MERCLQHSGLRTQDMDNFRPVVSVTVTVATTEVSVMVVYGVSSVYVAVSPSSAYMT
jgi:hypothetical protein